MANSVQKQHRVFYGWWIVGALLCISGYISGVAIAGFTAFIEPIANEFGWSYAQISFAASIRGLEIGLFAPLVGFLLDRWGPRKLLVPGVVLIGLGLLILSRITSLGMFYGAFILIAIGLSTYTGVLPMTVVANWFRKKASIATGIVVCGAGIGGLLLPLVTRIIDIFDWRGAVVIFGLGAFVILIPLSLLVRHKPEQYGYLPDGDINGKLVSSEAVTQSRIPEVNIGVRQALKSRVFWQVSLAFMCHFWAILAVTTHVMPYLSTIGISRSTSSLAAGAIPIISILGRLSFGWLGDRFDKRRVTAVGFALTSLSMLLFIYIAAVGTWLLVPFVILFGIGWGGPVPMTSALLREYFGRAKLGTILGLALGVAFIGNIVGPPLAGWVFDSFGSYQGAWFILVGVVIAGMVSLLTVPSAGAILKSRQSLYS